MPENQAGPEEAAEGHTPRHPFRHLSGPGWSQQAHQKGEGGREGGGQQGTTPGVNVGSHPWAQEAPGPSWDVPQGWGEDEFSTNTGDILPREDPPDSCPRAEATTPVGPVD